MSFNESNTSQGDGGFRQYLPDLTTPRFARMGSQTAQEYAQEFKEKGQPPWFYALYLHWQELYSQPFQGITNDGKVRDGLFELQDEGIPIDTIVDAATSVVNALDDRQKKAAVYHVDSPEWRTWTNPEFLLNDKGVRLDQLAIGTRMKVLKVLEVTLSPEGYHKAIGAMEINHFLGELVAAPRIMNRHSYNFVLFGQPSTSRPWGYSFYGHHLCLNIFLYKSQIVISPWFTGAEPNLIDRGPREGLTILRKEETLGLQLMQTLEAGLQEKAQMYRLLRDPEKMPWGRWNHDDQRHLCGAYQDNRVVPYEGILVSDMSETQQELVLQICDEFLLYLPRRARQIRLAQIRSWFIETYWCWIGGFAHNDPFYYRIQSPVVIIEFDHHSGVHLANKEPAKFHIHTLLRTPNKGDYGVALRGQIPRVRHEFVWEGPGQDIQ